VTAVRVSLDVGSGLAAVTAYEGPLPVAVRVVGLEVGAVVAANAPPAGCPGRCCRRNVYRLLDDLVGRAAM
jgi:hypothetical protein